MKTPAFVLAGSIACLAPVNAWTQCSGALDATPVADEQRGRVLLPAASWKGACLAVTLEQSEEGSFEVVAAVPAELGRGLFDPVLMKAIGDMLHPPAGISSGAADEEIAWDILERLASPGGISTDRPLARDIARVAQAAQSLLGPTEWEVFRSDPRRGIFVLIDGYLAEQEAIRRYPNSLENGLGDAFRHGYWQALSAFHTGEEYAKAFGDAHEIDFPNPPLEQEMDLFNNAVGRGIGLASSNVRRVDENVEIGIAEGDFVHIKDGELVPTDQ